jgi:integrase
MKFSDNVIASLVLPKGKSEHFEWDPMMPGFGVRLRGQSKSWVAQYRINRQQRRESLGDVRKVKLVDARKIARRRFAEAELGVDAGAKKKASALTLGVVIKRYLDARKPVLRPSSYRNAVRYLDASWAPLHKRTLADIKRADVASRLQELSKHGHRAAAARARECLSALYTWALGEALCEANPVIGTNDPNAGSRPRDRVLSDGELCVIWNACGDDSAGRAIRLVLLTGTRRAELGALKWSEFVGGTLTILGERTKNGQTLMLPLPAFARAILAEIPQQEGEFVFGRRGRVPFSGWSLAKTRLDARITMMTGQPLAHWTLHDLRRTMRTGLSRLGVQPHIAELAINHVRTTGVAATYDRHTYQREIADALQRWSEHVSAVVEGRDSKVVALRGA